MERWRGERRRERRYRWRDGAKLTSGCGKGRYV